MAKLADNADEGRYGIKKAERKPGRNVRIILLRLLASLAVNMYLYAGFTSVRTTVFFDDGGTASLALYISCVVLAYLAGGLLSGKALQKARKISRTKAMKFAAFMLGIRRMGRSLALLAAWLLLAAPVAAAFVIYGGHGVLRLLLEMAAAATAYIVSFRHTQLLPARIIGGIGFVAGLFILAVSLELPYLVGEITYLRPWVFGALYFLILSYLVVRNQEDIDTNIYSKKFVEKSILPRNLRRYNTILVCFVFLLILLSFNFRTVVAWIISLAGRLINIIVRLLVRLMELIVPDGKPIEGAGLAEEGIFPPDQIAERPSPYLNLVFNTFCYFVAFYLSYRLVFLVILKLPSLAAKLADILRNLFRIKNAGMDHEESDYIDVAETVPPQKKEKVVRRTGRKKKRTARQLRKIKDPAERIRYMYGLILDMLPVRGIRPAPCDTTAEVLAKAAGNGDLDGLHPFTEIYDRVRYGCMTPDGETLSRAETHYTRTYDALRGNPQ